jgi:hypothetical protein
MTWLSMRARSANAALLLAPGLQTSSTLGSISRFQEKFAILELDTGDA